MLGVLATGGAMYVLNPAFGAVNTAMNSWLGSMQGANIVLLGAIVAGMQSTDFGGPINKASYVFSTGLLADAALGSQGQMVMAACMAGGMVPPILIALSTTLFKNRWSKADRDAGLVNYLMGLSFISEGAIPFAASDPGHVIPSCIVVQCNFSGEEQPALAVEGAEVLIGNYDDPLAGGVLHPWEGVAHIWR